METGQELIRRLTIQQGQYQALKEAVARQAAHIGAMDVAGLTTDMAEIRSLMRKVRDLEADLRPLRQSWHSLGLDRSPSERREADELMESLEHLEQQIAELDAKMADRAHASDWDQLQQWSSERRELDAQRQSSYQRWEELEGLLAGES